MEEPVLQLPQIKLVFGLQRFIRKELPVKVQMLKLRRADPSSLNSKCHREIFAATPLRVRPPILPLP